MERPYPSLDAALALLDGWPVTTAGAAVVGPAGSAAPATSGATSHRFALASVTKPLFAYAVLVAIEEGTLELDAPVTRAPAPSGTTVRHLLAHASGLPFDHGGPVGEPEERRIYSNVGFDVLGDELAERAGMPAAEYLDLAVCRPLGLTATALVGSPAKDGISTVDDLARFVAELLAPTLVHRSTLDDATTPQFPDLAGLLPGFGRQTPNPWGLGFELRDHKSPHWTGSANSPATFGHFGQAGTMLWVDPTVGVGVVALADRPFGAWAAEAWPAFSDAVLTAVV